MSPDTPSPSPPAPRGPRSTAADRLATVVVGPGRLATVVVLALAVVGVAVFVVDLSPRVEEEFFFSEDDPQLAESRAIAERFPSGGVTATAPAADGADNDRADDEADDEQATGDGADDGGSGGGQILVAAVAPDLRAPETLERVGALTDALAELPGVATVRSLTRGPPRPRDAFEGPFWSRLLMAPDGSATLLVVELGPDASPQRLVPTIEELLERSEAPGFRLHASGVPWVVEKIRQNLERDLRVFSLAAVLLFGLVATLLYRDPWIVGGAFLASVVAAAATLLALRGLELPIGLLTANIATIVFVLAFSHAVYLTAQHARASAEAGDDATPRSLVARALARTAEPSFWSMATTVLGFSSLLFASAKPMRDLGLAGAVGSLVAFVAAYGLYPAFLARARHGRGLLGRGLPRRKSAGDRGAEPAALSASPAAIDPLAGRRLGGWVVALAVVVAVCAVALPRLETDPPLFAYFAPEGSLRGGLEAVDAAGGSSPLTVVFRDVDGARLDQPPVLERLGRVQRSLEEDPATGSVLSLSVLVDEARRVPLAALMTPEQLVDLLSSPLFQGAARAFVDPERQEGLVILRMREASREAPRRQVIERLEAAFAAEGFEPVLAGGLYDLQGRLSKLVARSLFGGLAGLALLFVLVALAATRSGRATAAMIACLAATPVVLFGLAGWLRVPLDALSAPAANVAVAVGIDSMIHLAVAARRFRRRGLAAWPAWCAARGAVGPAVAGATLVLAAGFGLFALSSFPPTQRFGLGVVVGLATAATLTLVALPRLAAPAADDETRRD